MIVGFGFSGSFGAAVLYKKKDDESLVIIKEINMLDLKKTERALAMNEVRCVYMLFRSVLIRIFKHPIYLYQKEPILIIYRSNYCYIFCKVADKI